MTALSFLPSQILHRWDFASSNTEESSDEAHMGNWGGGLGSWGRQQRDSWNFGLNDRDEENSLSRQGRAVYSQDSPGRLDELFILQVSLCLAMLSWQSKRRPRTEAQLRLRCHQTQGIQWLIHQFLDAHTAGY